MEVVVEVDKPKLLWILKRLNHIPITDTVVWATEAESSRRIHEIIRGKTRCKCTSTVNYFLI